MKLPLYVKELIDKLNDNGYEAYAVGGCVRDSLLSKIPKDYDVTTSAAPEKIKECLSDYKTIDTGIKFGTVTVISDGKPVEITTYRVDGKYNDNRRPESVTFTDLLAEDLKRRDFTVNAIAFNPKTGIIDLFGGQNDLKNGIIRAIGNPTDRFNEDGLRIMRALRFASCYNFEIEEKTAAAIHNCKNLLDNIAVERISTEFNRLICGNCGKILREFHDVISVFIPELSECVGFEQYTKYHNRDVYEHIIATVEAIEPKKYLRLAMFFHDIGKPQYFKLDEKGTGHFKGHPVGSRNIAENVLKRLKYDNETTKNVLSLVENHDIIIENRDKLIRRYLSKFGVDMFKDIVAVHIADDIGKSPDYQSRIEGYKAVLKRIDEIVLENGYITLKNMAVNGKDMIKLGFSGAEIGKILDELLNLVIDEKCVNERSVLISEAQKRRCNY